MESMLRCLHAFAWRTYALPTALDLPEIRITVLPAVVTSLLMAGVALLGFHPAFGSNLPRHFDKVLHFVGFGTMTFATYWTVQLSGTSENDVRGFRLPLVITAVIWISASVLSEILQALLPYKMFQFGDIFANLGGTALSLWLAYRTELARGRSHIQSSLYEAVDVDYNSTGSSEAI